MIYSNETQGALMRPFLTEFLLSVSVVQFTVQMSKLNGLRIFVVDLRLKLRSSFTTNKIV